MQAFQFHDSGEEISRGKLVIDVSYFGWHIHSETHDLLTRNIIPCFFYDSWNLENTVIVTSKINVMTLLEIV